MRRQPLDSRTIVAGCYDAGSQTLELEFASGRVYQYAEVPAAVYEWLLRTKSKGAYVSRMINGKYAHRDVTREPTATVDLEAMLRASLAEREPQR